jgi:hypothetical protein
LLDAVVLLVLELLEGLVLPLALLLPLLLLLLLLFMEELLVFELAVSFLMALAIQGGRGPKVSPRAGRTTLPTRRIWSTMPCTSSAGRKAATVGSECGRDACDLRHCNAAHGAGTDSNSQHKSFVFSLGQADACQQMLVAELLLRVHRALEC